MIRLACLCPTYNRFPTHGHLLAEAVESFLRQDIPDGIHAELWILNDCADQILVCHARNVRVINTCHRYPTLGDKFNALVRLSCATILMPWEDDDISLPLRIRQGVEMLRQDPAGAQCDNELAKPKYWKPPQVWYLEGDKPPQYRHNVGVRHHASAFTRAAFDRVGGYPSISGAQDAGMDSRLRDAFWGGWDMPGFPHGIPPSEWQYVYRWGVSPVHLSGFGDSDKAYRDEGGKPAAKGEFTIVPLWLRNYTAECLDALK